WLDANERLTDAQKGFRHFNGCNEHAFIASAILDQTRRRPRELHMVWYDLRNAFGSIPPSLMWCVMRKIGVSSSFVSRCENIYHGSFTTIANGLGGATEPIRHELGVYQGCPLSPTLFIVGIMPLVRALHGLRSSGVQLAADTSVSVSAYADDIKTVSSSADGIRQAHKIVTDFLRWSTMAANASNYTYLGVGDGFDRVKQRVSIVPTIQSLKRELTAIFRSDLAPWQMVRAVKSHVIPKAEYLLRHVRPLQQQLQAFDSALARGVRHALRLPPVSLSAVMYSPPGSGGLGFVKMTQLLAATQVAHAWQMLHSRDLSVRTIARAQVMQIVQKRFTLDAVHWRDRDAELIQLFLNSELAASPFATAKRAHGDVGSLWVDVQRHLRTMELRFTNETFTAQDGSVTERALQLRVPHHRKVLQHKTVARQIKQHIKLLALAEWKAAADQGRTVRAHGQLGSAFMNRGGGLSDAEYRFAIRARLNLVCTRAVLKRMRQLRTPTCRVAGCTHAETLPHVLNHCKGSEEIIRGRHDNVLALVRREVEAAVERSQGAFSAHFEEQVEGFTGAAFRPDIQLFDRSSRAVVISDVAVAFEDQTSEDTGSSNLAFVHDVKLRKYAPLVRHLERQGWRVKLSAIVFGSLGSVSPRNFKILTEDLHLLKKTANKTLRSASTAAIKASHRIWRLHAGGEQIRQARGTTGDRVATANADANAPPTERTRSVKATQQRHNDKMDACGSLETCAWDAQHLQQQQQQPLSCQTRVLAPASAHAAELVLAAATRAEVQWRAHRTIYTCDGSGRAARHAFSRW
ncbi:hypothetical protein PybrP1_005311, partial [[Pythium] brassicae (nom. inval.)]